MIWTWFLYAYIKYFFGDTFSVEDLVVTAHYSGDYEDEAIALNDVTITGLAWLVQNYKKVAPNLVQKYKKVAPNLVQIIFTILFLKGAPVRRS